MNTKAKTDNKEALKMLELSSSVCPPPVPSEIQSLPGVVGTLYPDSQVTALPVEASQVAALVPQAVQVLVEVK